MVTADTCVFGTALGNDGSRSVVISHDRTDTLESSRRV